MPRYPIRTLLRLFPLLAWGLPCLLLCLAAGQAGAQTPRVEKSLVITHVSVVDVRAGRLLPDQSVVISGERIVSVGPSGKAKIPAGARIVPGKGRFLLPGLFDSHVHLNNSEQDARMLISNGVTFVRDMGGEMADRMGQRAQARRGDFLGLEMAAVGTILDGSPPYHAWSRACATPEDGRTAVGEMAHAGVDQIKVYSLLKPDVHRAICEEAKRRGLKVVGHVPDAMTLEEAVADGQSGVEHLSRFTSLLADLLPRVKAAPGAFDGGLWARYPDVDQTALHKRLRKLGAEGLVMCPTLVLHAGQARILDAPTRALWEQYALPDDRRGWGEIPAQYAEYGRTQAVAFPYLKQALLALHEAGIPLLVGTDLANPGIVAGFSVNIEMQYWQEAGLPTADILRSATLTPARFLGVESRLGTVEIGKTASLVLTRKNPLADVRNAAAIEAVFARGRYFDRAALDALLAAAREDILTRSPDPVRKAQLSLPGEVVARGRYALSYGPYMDGTEEYLITRDGPVYRYAALRRQPGFGRFPLLQTGEWNTDFTPVAGALDPFVLLPTVARYEVRMNQIIIRAFRQEKTLRVSNAPLPAGSALRSPLALGRFLLVSGAGKGWRDEAGRNPARGNTADCASEGRS